MKPPPKRRSSSSSSTGPAPVDPAPVPVRNTGISGRALAILAAFAAILAAAFVLAPRMLAGNRPGGGYFDQRSLVATAGEAFIGYWSSGDEEFSPALETLVDYWFRYHLAKAVIAAILLAVLGALGVLLWRAFLRAGDLGAARRAAVAGAGVLVTTLALVSLVLVMANLQGALAPFSSLVSLLPAGDTDGQLADTLSEVREHLAGVPGAGDRTTPALDVMLQDFSRYHAVMAVIAAVVAVVLIGMSVVSWTMFRTRSLDRRARRLWGAFGVVSALLSLVVLVIGVANTTTAANPVPALAAFFQGS